MTDAKSIPQTVQVGGERTSLASESVVGEVAVRLEAIGTVWEGVKADEETLGWTNPMVSTEFGANERLSNFSSSIFVTLFSERETVFAFRTDCEAMKRGACENLGQELQD